MRRQVGARSCRRGAAAGRFWGCHKSIICICGLVGRHIRLEQIDAQLKPSVHSAHLASFYRTDCVGLPRALFLYLRVVRGRGPHVALGMGRQARLYLWQQTERSMIRSCNSEENSSLSRKCMQGRESSWH